MEKNSGRPNVLWICTDQQRFDTLGCYGNEFVTTPAIDRLAREGLLFEQCYAQNPLCQPSRGAFLTGRYPVTNRLRQNGQECPPDLPLITKMMADEGYVCGLAGKLHLNACDYRLGRFGKEWWRVEDRDRYFDGIEKRMDDGYAEFHWDHAPSGHFRSSAYTQWVRAKGQKVIENRPFEDSKHVFLGMPPELRQTTFCAEKAVQFMEAHAGAPYPWLFSVNIFDPHPSFNPPEEYLKPYLERLDEIPPPNYAEGELENKPRHQKERRLKHDPAIGEREHRLARAAYWAMVDHIDVNVNRMLEALERTGQRENTLVIFHSDHGELLGDHGSYPKGPMLYDCAVHVPLILAWPGVIQPGRRCAGLVELADIAPTILDAIGMPRHPGMQARSLWPLAKGEAPLDHFRDDIYCEYYNSNPDNPALNITMVRTERRKIAVVHNTGEGELYNLENDPAETRNLWDDPAAAELKTEMLLRLAARMAFTADPLPPRIGIY